MPLHMGKLGNSTICAHQPVIVRFENQTMLEFENVEGAHGFLKFYAQNQTASCQNPAKLYRLCAGVWVEQPLPSPDEPHI
jgi:hypothetical protein